MSTRLRLFALLLSASLAGGGCATPTPPPAGGGPSSPPGGPLLGSHDTAAVQDRVHSFLDALSRGDLPGAVAAYDPANGSWRTEVSGWLSQYTSQSVSFDNIQVDQVTFNAGIAHTTARFQLDGLTSQQDFTAVHRASGWYLAGPDAANLGPLHSTNSQHFVTFYYSWDQGSASAVAKAGDAVFDLVMSDFQVPAGDALRTQTYSLEVAPTASTMPGQVRDRLGATDLSTIYVRTPSLWPYPADGGLQPAISPVVAHELTHVIAGQFDYTMPAWLTEGAATWEQERRTTGAQLTTDRTVFHDFLVRPTRLPTLDELSVEDPFAASGETSTRAYGESESIVAYMVQRWGVVALRKFMQGHGQALSEDQSSRQAFGEPLSAVYAQWLALVKQGNPPF